MTPKKKQIRLSEANRIWVRLLTDCENMSSTGKCNNTCQEDLAKRFTDDPLVCCFYCKGFNNCLQRCQFVRKGE